MRFYLLFLILFCVSLISFSQNQNIISIGILDDKGDKKLDPILESLKEEIRAVVGKENKVEFKSVLLNNFESDKAKENYQKLLNDNTDIILAFGVVNTIMLHNEKNFPKPIILLSPINRDFIRFSDKKKTSGIDNLTFLLTPFSFSEDLEALKKLIDYKNLGILVDEFILNLLPIKQYFEKYFRDKEVNVKIVSVNETTDITTQLDGFDAVYLGLNRSSDDKQFDQIIDAINENGIPSLTAFGINDVKRGVLATYEAEVNYELFFRRIALNIESILNGVNPKDLPIFLDYNKILSINVVTANQIDFPLKYGMVDKTNFVVGKNRNLSTTFSIVDVMNRVIENNLLLQADKKEVELSEQKVKVSKSNYLPRIDASASGIYLDKETAKIALGSKPEFSTSGNIGLEQVIYSEQSSANISIQKNLKKAQEQSYNTSLLNALLNAYKAYFNTLILQTNVYIQNQNLQITKKNLKIAEQNYEVGASGKSDVLRFKSELSQNLQSLIEGSNSLNQAYYSLNQLMNRPILAKISIEDANLESELFEKYKYTDLLKILDDPKKRPALIDFFIDEALRNAPEIKNIDYNLKAINRSYKLNSYGRFIPTLALKGAYNYTFSRSGEGAVVPQGYPVPPDGNYNVALNLSIPIFQRNQQNISHQTSIIQQTQLNIKRAGAIQDIEKQVNSIASALLKEISNIETSKANEKYARESLDLSQNAYKVGSIPVIQLLDAQNNYLKAQLVRATAQYNYLLVLAEMQRVLGYFLFLNSEADNNEFILRARQFIINYDK